MRRFVHRPFVRPALLVAVVILSALALLIEYA